MDNDDFLEQKSYQILTSQLNCLTKNIELVSEEGNQYVIEIIKIEIDKHNNQLLIDTGEEILRTQGKLIALNDLSWIFEDRKRQCTLLRGFLPAEHEG